LLPMLSLEIFHVRWVKVVHLVVSGWHLAHADETLRFLQATSLLETFVELIRVITIRNLERNFLAWCQVASALAKVETGDGRLFAKGGNLGRHVSVGLCLFRLEQISSSCEGSNTRRMLCVSEVAD